VRFADALRAHRLKGNLVIKIIKAPCPFGSTDSGIDGRRSSCELADRGMVLVNQFPTVFGNLPRQITAANSTTASGRGLLVSVASTPAGFSR
jgi:hypothetical protein